MTSQEHDVHHATCCNGLPATCMGAASQLTACTGGRCMCIRLYRRRLAYMPAYALAATEDILTVTKCTVLKLATHGL